MKRIASLIAAAAATAAFAGMTHAADYRTTSPVTVDVLPAIHTYGLNIGTDSHYCFVDLVGAHVAAGCERAQS